MSQDKKPADKKPTLLTEVDVLQFGENPSQILTEGQNPSSTRASARPQISPRLPPPKPKP